MMMAWRLYVDDNQDKVRQPTATATALADVGWILLQQSSNLEYRTRHQEKLLWPIAV